MLPRATRPSEATNRGLADGRRPSLRLGLGFVVSGALLLATATSAPAASRYYLHSDTGSYQTDVAAALALDPTKGTFCRQPPGSSATSDAPTKTVPATAAAGGQPGPYCQGQAYWPSWGLAPAHTTAVSAVCVDLYVSGSSRSLYYYLISRTGIFDSVSRVSGLIAYEPGAIVRVRHKMTADVGNVVAFGIGNVPPGWPSGTHPNLYVHYDAGATPSSVTLNC